jgi:hypothetical protein
LLKVTAVVSLLWAVLLLAFKELAFPPNDLTPLVRALANGLGTASGALAFLFWYAASDPPAHRDAVYTAIVLQLGKALNDVYEVLRLLPPEQALVSLLDLFVSVALLAALLEALPRTLAAARRE